jgi:hypothetical protein
VGKAPWFWFCLEEWKQDTRFLSLKEGGAWMDLLCHMYLASPRGQLTHTLEEYAGLIQATEEETEALLLTLIELRLADVEIQSDDGQVHSEGLLSDGLGRGRVTLRDGRNRLSPHTPRRGCGGV